MSDSFLRLSQLASKIEEVVNGSFSNMTYWVIADLTNHTFKRQTNYHYFELVEKHADSSRIIAKISGKAWGPASANILNFEKITGQKFTNNIQLLLQVSVQYSPSFGLQLNLLDVDVNFTLGQFQRQRALTLLKLVNENSGFIRKVGDTYLTKNNQLSLNKVIRKIAVISSETSAGYQDFRHTLIHNSYGYKFNIDDYFTLIQGDLNAKRLVSKIIEVYSSGIQYDLVVIIRGGGSQTDFLIFDNYEVCRAIAKFPIPIVTGIGHQKNESISDLVAHTSTKTPTQTAEFILAHNRAFEESLLNMQKTIIIRTQQQLSREKQKLSSVKSQLIKDMLSLLNHHKIQLEKSAVKVVMFPQVNLSDLRRSLLYTQLSIENYTRLFFIQKEKSLNHFASLMKIMNPQNILNKGFALVKINGEIVSNTDDVNVGMEVSIQLASTELRTVVKSKSNL
jgi:exodeoxyribonuclease VII large subunit